MIIVWDEPKRLQNLAKHGLDFAEFEAGFDADTALVVTAKGGRFMMIGMFRGVLLAAVVAAPLGAEAISLVSMRPASKKERDLYDQ
ncbi:BrnT family toxin [Acidocella facilis]|uniref:BrnT family toxin n=1 Tax=Acidocella facilis TaxID=525 RepID=UPI001F195EE2|nr:BrnT family toxin [Acidocella facilis]